MTDFSAEGSGGPRPLAAAESARDARGGRPVTVALEGGGSLGAFAWGVLGRLLDEPGLRIAAVSGTSAGAMNAAMLAQGLATGGPGEAKRLLELFWRRVAVAAGSPDWDAAPRLSGPLRRLMAPVTDALRREVLLHYSPSAFAPNPLRPVLEGLLDPSVFGGPGAPMLVVSATRVRTGEARLFVDREVTADALLASACLPQVFPAVEIAGEAYWDGGYASNPPLRPLIEAGAPSDVIVVRTTPFERPGTPAGAGAIGHRVNEIAFGGALRAELRSLAVAQRLLADLPQAPGVLARLRDARIHVIGDEDAFRSLPGGSALDPSWGFLLRMRELGHDAAEAWLARHRSDLGHKPSFDLSGFAAPGLHGRATWYAAPGTGGEEAFDASSPT